MSQSGILKCPLIAVISESSCKKVLPSPPQSKLQSHTSEKSLCASPKTGQSLTFQVQTKAADKQLKKCPYAQYAMKHQSPPQCLEDKKRARTQKKSKRPSKEQKSDESSVDKSSPEISLDEIITLFKPMLPCLSPLNDLVRICFYFICVFVVSYIFSRLNQWFAC